MNAWILVVSFLFNTNAPIVDVTNVLQQQIKDEVIRDKQGRVVIFNDVPTCEQVGVEVMDRMIKNTGVVPIQYRCIKAETTK